MSKAAATAAKAAAGRPSIQSYGVLFVLRSQVDFTIIQCSDSVLAVLGWGPSELVGQSIKNILDFSSIQRLVSASSNIEEEGRMLRLKFDVRAGALSGARTAHGTIKAEELSLFVGSLHMVQGGLVLEVEPEVYPTFDKAGFTPALLDAAYEVESSKSLREFCRGLLQLLMRATGFEKGIIEEYGSTSAKIVEEVIDRIGPDAREVHLTPSTPLQLPEKDMKALQAFLMKRPVHYVMDAGADPSPIVPAVNPSTMQTLDMSSAYLRSPPPALLSHLQYSGATACLSVAVVQRDRLWGVISCHSGEARFVGREDRALLLESVETIAAMLTARLQAHEEEMAKHRSLQLETLYDGALTSREFGRTLVGDPNASPTSMADVVPCTGCAVLYQNQLSVRGSTPKGEEVRELARFVAEHIAESAGKEGRQGGPQGGGTVGGATMHATTVRGVGRPGALPEVWYTDAVGDSAYPRRALLGDAAHGTLAVPLDPALSSFAFWFRTKRAERAAGRARGAVGSLGRGNNIAINVAALAAAAGAAGAGVAGEPWSGADMQGARLLGAMVSQAAAVLTLERIAAAPWYGVGGDWWHADAASSIAGSEGEGGEEAALSVAELEGDFVPPAEEAVGPGSARVGSTERSGPGTERTVRLGLDALEDPTEALEECTLPAVALQLPPLLQPPAHGWPPGFGPKVLAANGAASLALHRAGSDLAGHTLADVVGEEANGPLFRQLERVAAGPSELSPVLLSLPPPRRGGPRVQAIGYAVPAGPSAALLLVHDATEGRKEAEARIKDALAAKHAASAKAAPKGEQGAALRRLLRVLQFVVAPIARSADPGEFAALAALHRTLPPPRAAEPDPAAASMRRLAGEGLARTSSMASWGRSPGALAPAESWPAGGEAGERAELEATMPLEELFGRPLSAAPSAASLHAPPLLAGLPFGGNASLSILRPVSSAGSLPRPQTADPVLQRPAAGPSDRPGPPPGTAPAAAWGGHSQRGAAPAAGKAREARRPGYLAGTSRGTIPPGKIRPLVPMRGRQGRTVGLVDLKIDERVRAWGARGENDGTTDSLHKFVYGAGFLASLEGGGAERGPGAAAGSRGPSVTIESAASGGGGGLAPAPAAAGLPSGRHHETLSTQRGQSDAGQGAGPGEGPGAAGGEAGAGAGGLSRAASAGQLRPQTSTSDLLGSTAAMSLGRKLAGRLAQQQALAQSSRHGGGLWSPGSVYSTPPTPALGMSRQRSAPTLLGPAAAPPSAAWVAQTAISGVAGLEVFPGPKPARGCCDLRALLCATFLAASVKALRKHVTLRVTLEGAHAHRRGPHPVWARLDAARFRQHLHETLARALNVVHAGQVTLQVAVLEPRAAAGRGGQAAAPGGSLQAAAGEGEGRRGSVRVPVTFALQLQDGAVGVPRAELPTLHARFDSLMAFLHATPEAPSPAPPPPASPAPSAPPPPASADRGLERPQTAPSPALAVLVS